MAKLYYNCPGGAFGDCMPFGKDGVFYLYYLKDTRKPPEHRDPLDWQLVLTRDFVHYEDLGTAIPGGTPEEQDRSVISGSVVEGGGKYHAFYTGENLAFPAQGRPAQFQLHAVSEDLIHWTKTGPIEGVPTQPGYDPDDWRDPFVFWCQEQEEYLMLLGGRKAGPKTQQTGRTVQFASKDLEHWEFRGDFWAPGLYTMHEMPDLFYMDGWWYHIITEYSHRSKMIYRMSKSLQGPWLTPKDDAFDGRAYYAGRTFAMDGKRYLLGWVPTKVGDSDKGAFQWARHLCAPPALPAGGRHLGLRHAGHCPGRLRGRGEPGRRDAGRRPCPPGEGPAGGRRGLLQAGAGRELPGGDVHLRPAVLRKPGDRGELPVPVPCGGKPGDFREEPQLALAG